MVQYAVFVGDGGGGGGSGDGGPHTGAGKRGGRRATYSIYRRGYVTVLARTTHVFSLLKSLSLEYEIRRLSGRDLSPKRTNEKSQPDYDYTWLWLAKLPWARFGYPSRRTYDMIIPA